MRIVALIVIESEYQADAEEAIEELKGGKVFLGCETEYIELSRKQ